ncbi:hypothetical protein F5Y15DRAFT_343107 [Xylariaceae sp. FL0016]|nr:hypothetical protein F5Y15DRAFT_343107 [Xylariaceae sp. FL0016]
MQDKPMTERPKYAWRKAPRRFAPKSRKGCKTCKIRRIKCDLAQPGCHKCTSTGRKCDGYHESVAQTKQLPPSGCSSILLPNRGTRLEQVPHESDIAITEDIRFSDEFRTPTTAYHGSAVVPFIAHSPGTPGTVTDGPAMYFFELVTLPQLNEHRRSMSWIRTLLLFSHTVPAVHHAAVALSAAHQTYIHHATRVGTICWKREAIHHYNLAIRHLLHSDGFENDQITSRLITLLVCYLFTCSDILAGRHAQALDHMRGGIGLLKEATEMFQSDQDKAKEAENRQLIMVVTEQFHRLDTHAALCLMDWIPQIPAVQKDETMINIKDSVATASRQLISLDQATDNLQNLMVEVMSVRRWADKLSRDTQGVADVDLLAQLAIAYSFQKRDQLMSRLIGWSAEFEALVKQNLENWDVPDRHQVDMLRLHYLVATTFVLSYTGEGETSYDAFLPKFKVALSIASSLVAYDAVNDGYQNERSGAHPSFTVEMGIIPTLYLMGIKCRDPLVRRQTIRLLRRNPRREALWDSVSTSKIIELVMEIEEGEEAAEFASGLKGLIDILPCQRVTKIHWSPVDSSVAGSEMSVVFEVFSSSAEKGLITKTFIL